MASIRETITGVLGGQVPGQYAGYVDRVVGALEHREAGIREAIVAAAAGMGLPRDRANDALTRAGLGTGRAVAAVPEYPQSTDPAYAQVRQDNGSQPVPEGDVQQQILAVLQRIEARVQG